MSYFSIYWGVCLLGFFFFFPFSVECNNFEIKLLTFSPAAGEHRCYGLQGDLAQTCWLMLLVIAVYLQMGTSESLTSSPKMEFLGLLLVGLSFVTSIKLCLV